jgi:hypothetical protein
VLPCFAALQNRLAYLTNKCYGDADLEYYIAEAGHILGVRVGEGQGARAVLAEVCEDDDPTLFLGHLVLVLGGICWQGCMFCV